MAYVHEVGGLLFFFLNVYNKYKHKKSKKPLFLTDYNKKKLYKYKSISMIIDTIHFVGNLVCSLI